MPICPLFCVIESFLSLLHRILFYGHEHADEIFAFLAIVAKDVVLGYFCPCERECHCLTRLVERINQIHLLKLLFIQSYEPIQEKPSR